MKVIFKDVVKRANSKEDRFNTEKIYYVGGEHIHSNELVINERGNIKGSTIGPMFYFGFKAGQVLFVTRNPHLRKAAMVEFDGICSEKTLVLETMNPSVLRQDYLPIIMQSDNFWHYCEEHKSGGVNYFVNWSTLANYEFDLPSIEKQKEISNKVWSAYRLKQAYKKLLAATDEMVKSQFIEMFSSYQTTPVGNYIEDSYPGEWGTEDKDGNGVKVIRTTNFTNSGKLDLTDVVTRSISEKKIERKTIRKYDTILERSGGTTDNPVGRVVLFEEDEQYLCNNFTQVLRFKKVDPIFAFYSLFYFYHTNKIVVRSMGSKTTGIQNLNMSKYLEIGIPNASDDEQKKFVAIAKQADKSKFGDFKSQFIEMFSSYQTTPVGNYIEDSYPGEWGTEDKDGNGVKVIRTTNFTNSGKLDLTDVVTRSISEKKIERKTIRKYDTILERSGGTTDNPVGRVVLFEEDEQYLCNNFTQVLRFKKVDPIFAFYSLFYFYHTNKIVVRSMGSKTTGIQNLNMSKYLEIGIPNASDDEQKKFVAIAKQADKSKFELKQCIENIDKVINSLINGK